MKETVQHKRNSCGYNEKPVLQICGNCDAYACEFELPKWMAEYNKASPGSYRIEIHGQECNKRCADHGFAVKKTATCKFWRRGV